MALNDHDAWVPEEWTGNIIAEMMKNSAVEAVARPEPMSTKTKHVPRSGGMSVDVLDKGESYAEDATEDDEVLLYARKFGKAISLGDEDIKDAETLIQVVDQKKRDWAIAYSKGLDNACLATSGAMLMSANRPFTSVYQAVRTTDTGLSYTADDNYLATAGAVTYAKLSQTLGLYEDSDWFEEAATVVLASPAWKRFLRDIVDDQNRPIFVQGQGDNPDQLFGYEVRWTQGARVSTAATKAPTGNPLMIVGNRNLLILGRRSGPESFVAGADSGVGFLTDESKLKCRARRGFAVGHPKAFAVLEKTLN